MEPTGVLDSVTLPPGTEVLEGRLRVGKLLGRGGMGEVYLAEQISLQRPVALKVLRKDLLEQPGMAERFRREAMLLSTVDHPSVVRVIDFGESNGAAMLVMELVEGEPLDLALREGTFEVHRALPLLLQLAQGLVAIHERDIIHRDLKPENVILTRRGREERARLLDFGIARLVEPESGVTQVGAVIGTPQYMSPEQAGGQPLQPSSDLYSFGLLAYRMLSGESPFAGPGAREFLLQHLTTPPRPLVEAAPALAGHEALCALVMQCLEKEPSARPPSAEAIADRLLELQQPGAAGRASTPPARTNTAAQLSRLADDASRVVTRVTAAARREPQRARRVAGVALAALLLLGWLTWGQLTSPERRMAAALEEGKPLQVLGIADGIRQDDTLSARAQLLRALAFHHLDRHGDEERTLADLPEGALRDAATPALVAGLSEDFARNERRSERRRLLERVPPDVLRELARSDGATWERLGALRFLDASKQAAGLDLVRAYADYLSFDDCVARGHAAYRLGELGDARVASALTTLAALPKEPYNIFVQKNCGQDEAAAAIRKLGR